MIGPELMESICRTNAELMRSVIEPRAERRSAIDRELERLKREDAALRAPAGRWRNAWLLALGWRPNRNRRARA